MEIRLLGPLEVVHEADSLPVPQQKARAVLAYLALHANRWVGTEDIVDAVWGESPPATVAASLQNHVSRARRVLGADRLLSRPHGYLLQLEPDRIDVARFERLLAAARGANGAERAETLRRALALWRGPALADLRYEPFALTEAPRLEELRLGALEDRIDAELGLGEGAELVGELTTLTSEHPLRERLRGQLMLALYRSGRQAEALAAYHQARKALIDELGIEPSAALRELEAAILRQDPALEAPHAAASAPTEWRRRAVTVLFAEVTIDGAESDAEPGRDLVAGLLEELRAVAETYGGVAQAVTGDAALAVFGVPVAHEDDALRALRSAAALRDAIGDVNVAAASRGQRVELRIGIRTGDVLAAEGEATVSGGPVVVAKRLAELAGADEILLGPATMALVRDTVVVESVGPLAIRGRSQPLPAFRLVEVVEERPRAETPLVGRAGELESLTAAQARTVRERRAGLVLIVGEPGIGKSRLAHAFGESLAGEATVLAARYPSYGTGATYAPLADLVAAAAGERSQEGLLRLVADDPDGEAVARRVAGLVGLREGATGAGEAFWAVRRVFEGLARARPLVVVLEDLQWAEPTFLDLVEHLRDWTAAPLLLVATARDELLDARPTWAAQALRLRPLDELESHALVEALAGQATRDVRERVVQAAGGNPLFAEQLLRYSAEADAGELPPTLRALLASRLELLPAAERVLLERAAVAGREFWRGALVALSPDAEAGGVGRRLAALQERGLVLPARSALPGEDGFRFGHGLIRDAAYAFVAPAERAELHERLADWLEERAPEQEELAGAHLERAYRDRTAAGRRDRHARRLAADAGAHLGRAGVRAFKRGDVPATLNLLGRATELLPAGDVFRRELLCELGLALRTAGELERAETVLGEAQVRSAEAHDRRLELRAALELAYVRLYRDPKRNLPGLRQAALDAAPLFEALGDDRSLGRALAALGIVAGFACRFGERERAASRAAERLERAGWSPVVSIGDVASCLFYGPRPVAEAIGRCNELLEGSTGRATEAAVAAWLGALEAMDGRFDRGRELVARSRALYRELGQLVAATMIPTTAEATVEALAGDHPAAERALHAAVEFCEQHHEWAHLSSLAGQLGDAVYAQGRWAEAGEWATVAAERAADEDVHAQYWWRTVAARACARRGDLDRAEALAREALGLVGATDALNDHAKVLADLGEVLGVAGRADEAAAATAEAVALYERKGNAAAARNLRDSESASPERTTKSPRAGSPSRLARTE